MGRLPSDMRSGSLMRTHHGSDLRVRLAALPAGQLAGEQAAAGLAPGRALRGWEVLSKLLTMSVTATWEGPQLQRLFLRKRKRHH